MRILVSATALFVLSAPVAAQRRRWAAQKAWLPRLPFLDKTVVGPAYKEVAKKYAGQKDVEKHLVEKVKKGGSGVWGQVPMPRMPQCLTRTFKRSSNGFWYRSSACSALSQAKTVKSPFDLASARSDGMRFQTERQP